LLGAFAALAASLSGCGGGAGVGSPAGIVREQAMQYAMNAAATLVNDPASGLYHQRMRLGPTSGDGHGGWRVRVANRSGGTDLCVHVRSVRTIAGISPRVSVAACPSRTPNPVEPSSGSGGSA